MGLILLEALLAGLVFVVIVWWTMFSGRQKGELPQAAPPEHPAPKPLESLPPTDTADGAPK